MVIVFRLGDRRLADAARILFASEEGIGNNLTERRRRASDPPTLPNGDDAGSRRERGTSPISLRWVWVVLFAGIAAGAGATAVLWITRSVSHKDALDIGIKVAISVVGVLGVVLAVHRYNLSQAEHRRQQDADLAVREDAIARQITDLSSKASEQLGSEKATIRIGGLTDLERLAQAYPELRQTGVDRICAYLRAPFVPPYGTVSVRPEVAVAHVRNGNEILASTEENDRRLELDVRRTAQQILRRHLYWPADHREPPAMFWAGISLDLRDAALVEFGLGGCRVASADMRNATFYGTTLFERAVFEGLALFNAVTFKDDAMFAGATFNSVAWFGMARFEESAWFGATNFKGMTEFEGATFIGPASYADAAFHHIVRLAAAKFEYSCDLTGARTVGASPRSWAPGWRVEPDPHKPGEGRLIRIPSSQADEV
jgi:hypothetical protein